MISLSSQDQLRQRMAWALSQILIVTSQQIAEASSEPYLNYYDIFVRNAFGNYSDILKEVSYSPMMAEMLSFLDSKSSGKRFSNLLSLTFMIVLSIKCNENDHYSLCSKNIRTNGPTRREFRKRGYAAVLNWCVSIEYGWHFETL